MSNKYLVKLTPLEPYFFGDENTFRFGAKNNNYYISSKPVPPMTSIIGMLRYVLLQQNGQLNTDGMYKDTKLIKLKELIGEKGFTVGDNNDIGKIKYVSPLFLTDKESNFYIQVPFNKKGEIEEFKAIELTKDKSKTSFGEIRLPESNEFDVKKTVGLSYMNSQTGKIIENPINWTERVGISKTKKEQAYFKKKYAHLDKAYSFAFLLDVDCDLKDSVCYMGREKSAFAFSVEETTLKLEDVINFKSNEPFWYAASDLILKENITYTDFAMVQTDSYRLLSSDFSNEKLSIKLDNVLYKVIKAGSVFYQDDIQSIKDCLFKCNYGFNVLTKIEKQGE